ncbi:coiled-coil domain-containing protein 152 [Menidia menidia]|uniref:(Atlantic silverside) hypothetical protein n=1 Tax=Menidia menidia TaxID=238744 RepID=A0A8S4AJA7_9TELE|nr:unnamed protein product [Menidia menidia]
MAKLNSIDLDKLMEEFGELEQKITEVNDRNSILGIVLEDVNRHIKFSHAKERSLIQEKEGLLVMMSKLQQTLQEQCNLRVENERLKNEVLALKQMNERRVEAGMAEVQRLLSKIRAGEEGHKRELEALRQQCSREVEDAHREALSQIKTKDLCMKELMEGKDVALEEMKKRMKDQEREQQSELLKLQMEFGAKLARVQITAQWNQQQPHASSNLPHSVYKKKLQFFQEEKSKEIGALRQRIRELEEHQRANSLCDSRLKRRKT